VGEEWRGMGLICFYLPGKGDMVPDTKQIFGRKTVHVAFENLSRSPL
jgi:hypothetical protein